jgi:3-dehydroquinate dehydratase-2
MAKPIYILNGPNLGLLGQREPHIYGTATLADVEAACRAVSKAKGFDVVFRQTDAEHEMVAFLHEARLQAAGIVINPAGFSYFAVSVLDALKMCECTIVEVHISNIHRRDEKWRANSIMTGAATGIISGLGVHGYELAVEHIAKVAKA